jgi:hypothetical protein
LYHPKIYKVKIDNNFYENPFIQSGHILGTWRSECNGYERWRILDSRASLKVWADRIWTAFLDLLLRLWGAITNRLKGQTKKCGRKQKWPIRKYKHGIWLKIVSNEQERQPVYFPSSQTGLSRRQDRFSRVEQTFSLDSYKITSKLRLKDANTIIKTRHSFLLTTVTIQKFLPKLKTVWIIH